VIANEGTIERFYHDLWNRWDLAVADELVAADLRFRGSLGAMIAGREGFKAYVLAVRAAFPDWHNQIDELFACDDRVVARLTWTGTHLGPLHDMAPTGKRVEYVGAALFRLVDGRIVEAWVVGDTQQFWRALGRVEESSSTVPP
jgi:steroid delta-isomerase-like uncharacterized protein